MRVRVQLLNGFTVAVDGATTAGDSWSRRGAASLVKLLALSPDGRLHRDRVVDALWPDLTMDSALPRLHKAAFYARRALGTRDAVVLKDDVVALFPGATVEVDVDVFEAAAATAMTDPVSPAECVKALKLAGELLPDDLAEPWLEEPRESVRHRVAALLRGARRWEDLLRLEPANEEAHLELLREAVSRGDRYEGLRRYSRMEDILNAELGISPPPEAAALREQLLTAEPLAPSSRGDGRIPAHGHRDRDHLLERESELQDLVATVGSAIEARRGVVVLVSGEAGAGKSAFARAFLDQLNVDVTALMGGCDDLLAPRSLGPFRDMAAGDPELTAALATDRLDDALPAILQVLASRPSVVVVEDVHWADDATLDAIRYLARRVASIPAALLLTFRETGIGASHPLRRVLGGLLGPAVRRMSLPPLSVEAVRRLGHVTEEEASQIHRVTAGNPFFVTEVLASGRSGVPATVRDAVLARMGTLSEPGRMLLQRLSVIPARAERWLAGTLANGDQAVLLEAERSGMLIGDDAWVSFRHELSRQAIESSLLAGERLEANRLVVDALLTRPGAEPSRLVHHAERSGNIEVILERGPTAAIEAARLGAHRQAAEVLRVILEHRDRLDAHSTAELSMQRAYSLYLVNQFEGALGCAELAVTTAGLAGDPILLADALLVLARVVFFARGPLRAREAAERAVEILEPVGDDARLAAALTELARAHSNLAAVGIVANHSDRAEEFAERALVIAQRLGRDDMEAQASCYLGDARLARGDSRGGEDLRRAISLAASDSRLETRVRSYVNAAHGAYRSGRHEEAERYIAAGLRIAADGEFTAGEHRLRLTEAAVHASRGDWDRAIGELRALVNTPGEPNVMSALARSLLARLLARRGQSEAGDVLAVALADRHVADDSFVAGPLAVAKIELGWLDGSLGDLTNHARRALDMAEAAQHTSVHAELCAYLRRAGIEVPQPADPPGPWAPTLAGRWAEAAAAWGALGEQYEQAVVLATAPDSGASAEGLGMLRELGAVATIPAV